MRFKFLILLILFLAIAPQLARPQQVSKPLTRNQVTELVKAGMDNAELAQKVKRVGIDFDLTDDYLQDLRKAGAQDVLIQALRAARPKPLTREQVLQLVAGGVPSERAAALVKERGINFVPDQDYLETLRVAGAEEGLLAALRMAGEAVTAQLEIETSPNAEIYLDALLAGRAGADGRFEAKATSGVHALKVTLVGKKDFQKSLSVVAGQENRIDATLVDLEKPASSSTMVVLLENSTRCRICRAGEVTSWLNNFFTLLPREAWVAVVAFDMRPKIIADFTQDKKTIRAETARLQGTTIQESNLFDALADTADRIKAMKGKKSILVIATGNDTFSKLTYDSTLDSLRQAGVTIFGVELIDSTSVNSGVQNPLVGIALATHGKAWVAQSENMMPDVREVVATLSNAPP